MRPYVAGFIVNSKYGFETGSNGRQRRPVSTFDELIVSEPTGQCVIWQRLPTRLPYVLGELFHLFGTIARHVQQIQLERFAQQPLFFVRTLFIQLRL